MKRIKSISDKRLVIEAEVNGKTACLLVDTGAAVGLLDENQRKDYGLERGRRYSGTLMGVGGELKDVRVCNTFADFRGVMIPQFLLADISGIVKSVERETGTRILGVVSLPQLRMCNLSIDCNDMEIIIE